MELHYWDFTLSNLLHVRDTKLSQTLLGNTEEGGEESTTKEYTGAWEHLLWNIWIKSVFDSYAIA